MLVSAMGCATPPVGSVFHSLSFSAFFLPRVLVLLLFLAFRKTCSYVSTDDLFFLQFDLYHLTAHSYPPPALRPLRSLRLQQDCDTALQSQDPPSSGLLRHRKANKLNLAQILLLLLTIDSSTAHMVLANLPPLKSKLSSFTTRSDIDCSMISPLSSSGSCQTSLPLEGWGQTFPVIHSYVDGCPSTQGNSSFVSRVLGDVPPSDTVLFAWTWFD